MKTPVIPALLALLALPTVAHADGKALFTSNGCNKCHTVTAEGIALAPPEPGEEPRDKVLDLSGIAANGDATFFKGYVTKAVEAKNGKKHPRKFKGSDADLAALSEWLAGLKTPAPAPAGK